MSFWKSPRYNLTESEIRYAMRNSGNNSQAARFLHVSCAVYNKYAKMVIDAETGKSLFELHRHRKGASVHTKQRHRLSGAELLNGTHPSIPKSEFKRRIIEDGEFLDECGICGYSERRLFDNASPTILVFKNGDRRDFRRENVELVCHNCYNSYYGKLRPVGGYYKDEQTKIYEQYEPQQDDEIDFSQY